MIDILAIQEKIISVLNSIDTSMLFIKNYNSDNKPPYPYGTLGVTVGYIPENENNRPNLKQTYNATDNKIILTREEQPTVTLSFSVYSNIRETAVKKATDVVSSLKFTHEDLFSKYGIIFVEVGNPRQITGILEVDYEFRYQFDATIRVDSVLVKEIDVTEVVSLTDKNNNKTIEIKE